VILYCQRRLIFNGDDVIFNGDDVIFSGDDVIEPDEVTQ